MRNFSYEQKGRTFMDTFIANLRYGKIFKVLKDNTISLKEKQICDIGCGYNCNFLSYVSKIEKTISLSGVDLDVNPEIKKNIKISLSNLEKDKFDFDENSFDIVTSLAVIEHLNNPSNYLSEIKRILKPGGLFILTTPSIYAKPVLENFAKVGISTKEEVFDHKIYYTKQSLNKLIDKYFKFYKTSYFQLGMNILLVVKKQIHDR